jgi:murein DD-endopeptidase MepM/ murein hydrolase activator NlpD
MFSFVSPSDRLAVQHGVLRSLVIVSGAVALVGSFVGAGWPASPARAVVAQRVVYRPPVPGPIIDNWRPPEHPYGAGNLGIDFYARAGDPVFAAANGVVTFAGRVGRSLFVVILHADGLRTTLGFVQSILVPRGAQVTRGAVVAIAGGPVHFGVRQGSTYLDPRILFSVKVWLVE